jgi:hypothetical protein
LRTTCDRVEPATRTERGQRLATAKVERAPHRFIRFAGATARSSLSPCPQETQEERTNGQSQFHEGRAVRSRLVGADDQAGARFGISGNGLKKACIRANIPVPPLVAEIAGMFEAIRLRREREAEEQKRRWKLEEERRLAEMERKRETIRYRRLIDYCEDWRRAADIRAFFAVVEASPLASRDADAFARWKLWALAHADRIDPLQDEDLFNQQVDDYEVYSLRE